MRLVCSLPEVGGSANFAAPEVRSRVNGSSWKAEDEWHCCLTLQLACSVLIHIVDADGWGLDILLLPFCAAELLPYGKSSDYDANCIGFVGPWSKGLIYVAAAMFSIADCEVVLDSFAGSRASNRLLFGFFAILAGCGVGGRWLNCFAMGSSILLMEGAPSSQVLVHQIQLDWPMMGWRSTSVDAKTMLNAGCWQHHDSLLKGDVALLKLLLKPSCLQILVAANSITPLWLQHLSVSVDADVLTAIGVWLLASPLLMVLCICCGRTG
ncbi:hypothetical protein Nepgr_023096 [Nepenthes gracilis]|uniref:Uncharacterized protein n=1 Tax=Nepenthes gracilis TaxID=150966 RepID=A0AAD3XYQ4_NEPGR|nr:hypothetical protein Nepgr_023096 [Nepenthes gracilis]